LFFHFASGITSAVGEQCLTNAGALGVIPEPCLEAIAAGDGREVMKFDADEYSALSCNIDAAVFEMVISFFLLRASLFAARGALPLPK